MVCLYAGNVLFWICFTGYISINVGLLEIMKLVTKSTAAGFITGSFVPNIQKKLIMILLVETVKEIQFLKIKLLDCKNNGFLMNRHVKR